MVVLTVTVNEVREREGQTAPAARWGFLSSAAVFLATKRWQSAASNLLPGTAQEEEAGRLLSLRLEIIEATRAATSTGSRRLLRSSAGLHGSCASVKQQLWKQIQTPCLPTSPGRSRVSLSRITPGEALL